MRFVPSPVAAGTSPPLSPTRWSRLVREAAARLKTNGEIVQYVFRAGLAGEFGLDQDKPEPL